MAADPELAGLLAEQQRALGLAQAALADSEAPAALRARVAAQRRPADRAPMRGLLAMGVAVTAVLILGIVLTVTSGTSAEHLQAALAATPLSPGAGGEASFTKTASGWRIQLDASGLPRRDDPLFYQAWLRNAAGVLVPVGTFNDGRKVTLWAGVSPKDYPTITITRERADGDQASSGDKVLVGRAVAAS